MRSILVGMVVMVVGMAAPAFGGSIVDDSERRPGPARESALDTRPVTEERAVMHRTPPFDEVVVEEYHSAGAELGMGVASTILTLFYTPVRLAVGVVGAGLGGVEGWIVGGDLRTARSMWRPTVEGDYFIRPDHLDRTERYEFGNWQPITREEYTVHARQPVAYEEPIVEERMTAPAPSDDHEYEAVEPELEDADSLSDR